MHTPQDRIFRREMSRRDFIWLMGAAGSAVALPPLLSGCATDPVTGRTTLVGLTEQQEIALDRQHAPHQFSADYGVVQDDALNRYVQGVAAGLGARSHRPQMPYSARALNANYINAYTFPAGSMGITRGILLEMESEDELAAVLGHEAGHVNARHAARQAGKQMVAGTVLGVGQAVLSATGYADFAPVLDLGASLGASALLAKYSRDNEREADALGLEYMSRAGYNPDGMVATMDMLRGQSRAKPGLIETMFSSHPMSDERYETARREAQTRYAGERGRPLQKARYMDHTAELRKLRPAIEAMQQGETLMAKKQIGQAEGRFGQALGLAPRDYVANLLMAKAKIAQKQPKEAEPYLQQARAIYPGEAQAQSLSGIVKLALKQPDAAYQRFEDYDRLLPGNPNTLFFKGVAQENMQNRRAAADYYYRYLQAGARDSQAQYAQQRLKEWGVLK